MADDQTPSTSPSGIRPTDVESLNISISLPEKGYFLPGEHITGRISLSLSNDSQILEAYDRHKRSASVLAFEDAKLHIVIEGRTSAELQPYRFSKVLPDDRINDLFYISHMDAEIDQDATLAVDEQTLSLPFAVELGTEVQDCLRLPKAYHSGAYLPWTEPIALTKQNGKLIPPSFKYQLHNAQRNVSARIEYQVVAIFEATSSQTEGTSHKGNAKRGAESRVGKCPFVVCLPPIHPEAEERMGEQMKRNSSIMTFQGPQLAQNDQSSGKSSVFKKAKSFLSSKAASVQTMASVMTPSAVYSGDPYQLGIYLKAPEFPPDYQQPRNVLRGGVPDVAVTHVHTRIVQRIRTIGTHGFNSEDNICDEIIFEDQWIPVPGSSESILRAPNADNRETTGNVVVAHMRSLPSNLIPSFVSKHLECSYSVESQFTLDCKGVREVMEAKPTVQVAKRLAPDGAGPPVYLDAFKDAAGSGRRYTGTPADAQGLAGFGIGLGGIGM